LDHIFWVKATQAFHSSWGRILLGDQLDDAVAIAEIDESNWTMVTSVGDPTSQDDFRPDIFSAKLTAGM